MEKPGSRGRGKAVAYAVATAVFVAFFVLVLNPGTALASGPTLVGQVFVGSTVATTTLSTGSLTGITLDDALCVFLHVDYTHTGSVTVTNVADTGGNFFTKEVENNYTAGSQFLGAWCAFNVGAMNEVFTVTFSTGNATAPPMVLVAADITGWPFFEAAGTVGTVTGLVTTGVTSTVTPTRTNSLIVSAGVTQRGAGSLTTATSPVLSTSYACSGCVLEGPSPTGINADDATDHGASAVAYTVTFTGSAAATTRAMSLFSFALGSTATPAVTNLDGTDSGPSSVVLTWTQPAGPITNDTVAYGTTYGVYTNYKSAGAVSTTTIPSLTSGVTWFFEVWAYTAGTGQGPASNIVPIYTTPPPPVLIPPVLSGIGVTGTSAAFTWTSPTNFTVSNYSLDHGTVFGTYGTHASEGTALSATVTGLAQNTTYWFVVRAYNAGGTIVTSNVAPAHTLSNTPLQVGAVSVDVVGVSGTTASVDWSGPANFTVSNYSLNRGTAFGTYGTHTSEGTGQSATATGLSANTTYWFQVVAYNVGGSTVTSNAAPAHTPANTPPVVVAPAIWAAGTSGSSLVATWTAPQNVTVANYTLEWGTAYGTYTGFANEAAGTTEAAVTGLTVNSTYFVRVVAWPNPSAVGRVSNVAPAHTLPNAPPGVRVVLPPVLTATGIGTASVAVSWGAAANVTVANYTLAYGTAFGSYPTRLSEGTSTFEAVVAGLAANSTYWFVVYAGTAAGYAAVPSNVAPARTLSVSAPGPDFPVVTAAAVNMTGLTVSWRAPPGVVVNYTLEYARFYGLPIAFVSVGNHTVYNLTNLGVGLTYYVTVRAWNATAEGPPSNVAAAQTDPAPTVVPPFPWSTLTAITMLSILGSLAVSAAIAVFVSGRRARRAEGAAAIAVSRTAPRDRGGEVHRPAPRGSADYSRPRSRGP